MPFCVQCGTKLEDGARYCTSCGAKQPELTGTVYTPPTEERPAEPRSSSYTPSASSGAGQQNSYSYDPTIYGGRDGGGSGAPKKNRGAIVFIALAALVVIGAIIYIFSSLKGGKTTVSDDPVLGLYTAQKAEVSGISISIDTMWEKGFTIELRDKGKASLKVDGKTGSAKWTLDGEKFTVKGSGVDCSGTLKNGTLVLEDVMGSGVTLYFTKDGASIPTASSAPTEELPAPADQNEPAGEDDILGLYIADKAVAYGIELEITTMWKNGFTIELLEDGKCNITVDTASSKGTWALDGENITVTLGTMEMKGTCSDGVMALDDIFGMGMELYFTKDGVSLPDTLTADTPRDTAEYGWWDGDWYGWWGVSDAGGSYLEEGYVDDYWDACATIRVSGNTGSVEIWDEDDDSVAWADVSFGPGLSDKGCMTSLRGSFSNDALEKGEWTVDPADDLAAGFDDLFLIHGKYVQSANADNWLEYYIILRPWGTRWDDIENGDTSSMIYPGEMLPRYYESWYLPLIEAGAGMPGSFDLED